MGATQRIEGYIDQIRVKTMFARLSTAVAAIAFLIFLITGCDRTEVPLEWEKLAEKAQKQKEITLYVFKYGEYFDAVAKSFLKTYGIKVSVVTGSAEGTYQKILAERNSSGKVDLWLLSAPQVQPAVENNLLYGPIMERLPNRKYVVPFDAQYAEGFDHRGYVSPVWRNQAVFVYDSSIVDDPPMSLADLEQWLKLNPRLFTYCDPGRGGSGQAFVNSAIYWITGDPQQYFGRFDRSIIDEKWSNVWAWLRRIEPNVVYAADNNDALSKLARGEVLIASTWEEMYLQWRLDGRLSESIRAYLPRPGLPGGADFLGIPNSSTRKAAALFFLNYLLLRESQEMLISTIKMRPVRGDVPIPDLLAPLMIHPDEFERFRLPWPHPGYKKEYKIRWAEEMGLK